MKNETDFWKFINTRMGKRWHSQRHEDKMALGVPDVSFGMYGVNGWIELKYLPKKPKGFVKIRHFTIYQKNWLEDRQKAGGNCWLLLGIEKEAYLFKGDALEKLFKGKWKVSKKDCFSYHEPQQKTIFADWLTRCLVLFGQGEEKIT